MLEGNNKEDDVYLDTKKSKFIVFNTNYKPYENLKLAVNQLENVAFDQIDEDITTLAKENNTNLTDLGKTKVMLKSFMLI